MFFEISPDMLGQDCIAADEGAALEAMGTTGKVFFTRDIGFNIGRLVYLSLWRASEKLES